MNKDFILNSFIQSNSLNLLVESVSAAFGCPIIVTDNAFHIVSAFAASDYENDEYRKAVSHSELSLSVCTAIGIHFSESEQSHIIVAANACDCTVGTLQSADIALGYIIYVGIDNASANEKDFLFVESLVAKQFYLERHLNSTTADTAEEIVTDLLNGEFKSEEIFNVKIGGTFLAHFHPKKFAVITFESDIHKRNNSTSHLKNHLEDRFHASHPFFFDGNLIVFLHEDHDINILHSLSQEYSLKIAISDFPPKLYSMRSAYQTAKDTLLYITSHRNDDYFVAYCKDYALPIILQHISLYAPYLFNSEIEKLYEYDCENDSELCLTLYTYLTCHHSLQNTCDKLFTHRNTVLYRMRKIRDEFNINTDDPKRYLSDLLSLAIALLQSGHDELFVSESENRKN